MGGYAVYVWSAYGITAFLLMGLVFWTVLVLKNSVKELKALMSSSHRRNSNPTTEADTQSVKKINRRLLRHTVEAREMVNATAGMWK